MDSSRLREIRKANGWTQQNLADQLQVSQPVICNMEAGRQEIDRRTELAVLAVAAGIEPEGTKTNSLRGAGRFLDTAE